MDKLKLMSEREKYRRAFDMVRLYQTHVLPFVQERLGYPAMHQLRSVWQAAILPIPEAAPDGEKYEQAYNSWLWMARCTLDCVAGQMAPEAMADFEHLLVQIYRRQQDHPSQAVLRLLGDYPAMAEDLFFAMQWLTPLQLTSRTRSQVVCDVTDCKVLQNPGNEQVCQIVCRNAGTAYARETFNLQRVTVPSAHGCTITLMPLTHHLVV